MENRLRITLVKPEGSALLAGIQVGDVLLQYDGREIFTNDDLQAALRSEGPEKKTVLLYRNDQGICRLETDPGPLGVLISEIEFNPMIIGRTERLAQMIITTAPGIDGYRIVKHIDIITAECAYGMSIFKDIFAAFTDTFGGRSGSIQDALRDSRKTCLNELRNEASDLGANAIIGVDLDYSEFSGQGKSMLFLVASGTAVVVEPID